MTWRGDLVSPSIKGNEPGWGAAAQPSDWSEWRTLGQSA